jgi:hypothetical protein
MANPNLADFPFDSYERGRASSLPALILLDADEVFE